MNFTFYGLKNNRLLNNHLIKFDKTISRNICITSVLSGKSPAQSQKGHKRTPLVYELKCVPGDNVQQSIILATQKNLKYHPGINVALNPIDKSLYSLRAGTVYFSIEKFNPNPKSHFVQQFYPKFIGPVYKKYLHVIPKKDPIMFKLVDLI